MSMSFLKTNIPLNFLKKNYSNFKKILKKLKTKNIGEKKKPIYKDIFLKIVIYKAIFDPYKVPNCDKLIHPLRFSYFRTK